MKSKITLFALSIVIFLSCSIEKRNYRKGYYVDWKTNQHPVSKKEPAVVKNKKSELLIVKQPEIQNPVLASANDELFIKSITPKYINVFSEDCGDLIVLKNSEEVKAKVIEITETQVKYKPCDNLNGPVRSVEKKDVFMIKYANGSKETFNKEVEKHKTEENISRKKESKKEPFVGNPKKNWAAVLGFVLSFFVPFVAIWFCLIGLKSEKRTLAWIGYFICLLFFILIIAVAFV